MVTRTLDWFRGLSPSVLPKRPRQRVGALPFIGLLICAAAFFPRAGAADSGSRSDPPTPASILNLLTPQEKQWLAAHPVITVTQDPGWPPVEFAEADGRPTGISADYLALVEQRLNLSFKPVLNLSWQESYARLQRREIDMTTCVAVTPQRETFWAFTRPYLRIPIVILTRDDITFIDHMRKLNGKRVAVVEGYMANEWLRRDYPGIELVPVRTVKEGIDFLQQGRVFALIDNMLVIGHYMAKLKLVNLKIAGETPYVNAQCMAVRKDWPELAAILQKALDSITEEEQARIYERWAPIRYEHGTDYTLALGVLAGAAAVVAALVYWIRKLRAEIRLRLAAEASLLRENEARKKTEAALRESEIRVRSLFEATPDAMLVVGPDGRFLDLNPAVLDQFGYSREEILRLSPVEISAPDLRKTTSSLVEQARGVSMRFEWRICRQDGAEVPVEIYTRPFKYKGLSCILSSVRDISERQRHEDEKARLENQLLQAQKLEAVGRLASSVAHDFNNLLGGILGNAELLKEGLAPGSPLHAEVEGVIASCTKAKALTQQLLSFSRKAPAKLQAVDLNAVAAQVLGMLGRASDRRIEIVREMQDALPPILGDQGQIENALLNLLVNARDAMPEGGRLTLATRLVRLAKDSIPDEQSAVVPGDYLQISVADTGTGMSPEVLEHLFEPFFTTKEIGRGTGLGLASVYSCVKQHRGYITVDSRDGQGTRFDIYCPVGPAAGPAMEPASLVAAAPGKGKLLLVDDELIYHKSLGVLLSKLGYDIRTVDNGAEAVEHFRLHAGEIDVVILDMNMPKMSGLSCYRLLKEINPGVRVIISSGYGDSGERVALQREGVRHFLQKPYRAAELARLIEEIIRKGETEI